MYARHIAEILSGMANSVIFRTQNCRYLWLVGKIAEGEYIINSIFTYKVSLLLQSEFEPP